MAWPGSEDNRSEVQEDCYTGNVLPGSQDLRDWQPYAAYGRERIASPHAPMPQTPTYGRMTPPCPTPDFSWAPSLQEETNQPTGSTYGTPQPPETTAPFQRTSVCVVICPCEESQQTIYNRFKWSALYQYDGVRLARGNQEQAGMKPVYTVSLKFPRPSGGMATEVMNMLSSTNFVVESIYLMYFDGLIATHVTLKSKEDLYHSMQLGTGLRLTSTRMTGTQTLH